MPRRRLHQSRQQKAKSCIVSRLRQIERLCASVLLGISVFFHFIGTCTHLCVCEMCANVVVSAEFESENNNNTTIRRR